MGANQIDRYGNQNLSAFGPLQHPTRQMFGVRGAPGNTINHATSYWVGNRSKRVFGDSVDVVSGIGWDKVDPGQPGVPIRQRLPGGVQYRGVRLQRAGSSDACGVAASRDRSPKRCRRTPGSRYTTWTTASRLGFPPTDELKLLREVIDPKSLRDKEVRV